MSCNLFTHIIMHNSVGRKNKGFMAVFTNKINFYPYHSVMKLIAPLYMLLFLMAAFHSNAQSQRGGAIEIKLEGDRYITQDRTINISVLPTRTNPAIISEMKVGLADDYENLKWEPYQRSMTLELPDEDGIYEIKASLKDVPGNVSPVEITRVKLDRTPPEVKKFEINNEQLVTNNNNLRVRLFIEAEDAFQMQLSNQPAFSGSWIEYEPERYWTLGSRNEGFQMVYARFKDRIGNVSSMVVDTIILDLTPPQNCKVEINEDDRFTNERKVKLRIYGDDATLVRVVSSAKAEILSYRNDEGKDYMSLDWELDTLDGNKIIKAYFRDAAGNVTIQPVTSSIILDTQGPSAPFLKINNGNKYSTDPDGIVKVAVGTRVNPSTIRMAISTDENFEDVSYTEYEPVINEFKLDAQEDGEKVIFAKFIDEAGNESVVSMATVILDRKPPIAKSITINSDSTYASKSRLMIQMEAEDAVAYQVSNEASFTNASPLAPYATTLDTIDVGNAEGKFTLYVRFRDEAGNFSDPIFDDIIIDREPPRGGVVINNNEKFLTRKDRKATLYLRYDDDASFMQVVDYPDFSKNPWLEVKDSVEWTFSDEDGPKKVFVRFKDAAGNISRVYSSGVYLDRNGPQNPSVVINENAPYATNPERKLYAQVKADDARFVQVSTNREMESAWLPYRPIIPVDMPETEGQITVYARFKDEAGNISEAVFDDIIIDFTPPQITFFTIDNDSAFINDTTRQVTLSIRADDAKMMFISNQIITKSDTSIIWEPYAESRKWVLEKGEGTKRVFIITKDEAGNISNLAQDDIILDLTPPQAFQLSINNNDRFTNNLNKQVQLDIIADADALSVMLSNSKNFKNASWLPITKTIQDWDLDGEDGKKTIYAKFRDRAGNESKLAEASIILDRTPPEVESFTINSDSLFSRNKNHIVRLSHEVEEAAFMMISENNFFPEAEWVPFKTSHPYKLSDGQGEKDIFVQYRDAAGNISDIVSDQIILDYTPPEVVKFQINDGAEWTNDQEKKVTVTCFVEGAYEMMVTSKTDFNGVSWEAFTPTIEDFILEGDDGPKKVTAVFRDEAGNISRPVSAVIKLKREF